MLASLVVWAALVVAAHPALGQDALQVDVQTFEETLDGQARVVVDVTGVPPGDLDDGAFTVTEDGSDVGEVTATLASEEPDPEPRTVVLAIDVSDSTEGAPRDNAIAASKAFADTVIARGVAVGVVAFSVDVEIAQLPTTDAQEVSAALDDLVGGPETRLYDAVVVSSRVLTNFAGERSMVVFTDGTDVGSEATLDGATSAATIAGASVTSVALETEQLDVAPLESLADATNGRVVEVADAAGLETAFADVAQDLDSQYVLTYPATGISDQFQLEVAVSDGSTTAVGTLTALGRGAAPSVRPDVTVVAAPGWLSETVGVVTVGVLFVALALILLALFVPVGDRQVTRNLAAAVGTPAADGGVATQQDLSPTTAALSRRAIRLVERVPKPAGYDPSMQQRIDRAAWPLRSSEFTTLRALATLVAFGLAWAVLGSVLLAFVAGALGWVVPNIFLGMRLSARQRKFMDQLPDTLQLLAGSLKAGYGVLQAIDTVVKEAHDPSRSEFQRVLSEARLGLPLEQSLEDMADRIGTDDFRWVAVSISIQRRVGGNLAQLLETVASTLRERAATRRQISALSAEGRLSAVILTALPFALGIYMITVNPGYLETLFTTGVGQLMLAGAAVMMVIGIVWMRNLVEIDV